MLFTDTRQESGRNFVTNHTPLGFSLPATVMAGTRWACCGFQAPSSRTNEEPSRRRLHNAERKLRRNKKLKIEYDNIVHEQIEQGIIEKVPEQSTGERTFNMPHKPVVRERALRQRR